MGQALGFLRRNCFGMSRAKDNAVTKELVSLPDYDFRPTKEFRAAIGDEIIFSVVNPFDLMLQEQGLMADALVVEAKDNNNKTHVLWFRYSSRQLSAEGFSDCVLFTDEISSGVVFDGVCGMLFDRRRA